MTLTAGQAVEVTRARRYAGPIGEVGGRVRGRSAGAAAGLKRGDSVEERSAGFAEVVRGRVAGGPVLRYSERLKLLKEAGRMGVGRFEANLVIARVLHQEGLGQEVEYEPEGGGGWWVGVVGFVVVQGAVLGGAWWVLG